MLNSKKSLERRRLYPARRRLPEPVPFEGRIRMWGLAFLRRHHWRMKSMLSREDLEAEAFEIYWRLRQKYGYTVLDVNEFLKIYKVALYFRVNTLAKACFPNPYNASMEGGTSFSLTTIDGGDWLESVPSAVYNPCEKVDDCLDLLQNIPAELKEVATAIVKEFLGVQEIQVCYRRHLKGGWSVETLNQALSRVFGFPYSRNILGEFTETILAIKSKP